MKKLFLSLGIVILCTLSLSAQTPYDNFAPEQGVKSIIELSEMQFKVTNTDPNSEIRYVEFDKNTLSVNLLNEESSVLKTIALNPNSDRKFTTIDRLAEKYYSISPYAYCTNNPLRYIDPTGDSIDVSNLQTFDRVNRTDYLNRIITDLNAQTGLTFSVLGNMLVYSTDASGNPIVATTTDATGATVQAGSATARVLMIGAVNHTDVVTVSHGKSGVPVGTNQMGLNVRQIQNFVNGVNNVDNNTLGFGMTFMHELHHTQVGGGLRDTPGTPGPVVTQMNIIRAELNTLGGNYGQRQDYRATMIGTDTFIPFDGASQRALLRGDTPSTMNKYVKF